MRARRPGSGSKRNFVTSTQVSRERRRLHTQIDFNFGKSSNYAVIHDLRIECDGRVAQIDHLIIGRFLDFWVCESKHFSEGIAINEHGECSAFYQSRPYGVPSPFEQNQKHVTVLHSVFKTGMVDLPTRLGFAIKPKMVSMVLVSKNARISRPKVNTKGFENIIKNDQLRSFVDRSNDAGNNPLTLAKLIGLDTLEKLALSIAAAHKPITFNWAAKFGLAGLAPTNVSCSGPPRLPQSIPPMLPPVVEPTLPDTKVAAVAGEGSKPKQKLICTTCEEPVAFNVARFCWFNKAKFNGFVYCMDCQKKL